MLEQMIEVKEPPMSIAIVRYYWPDGWRKRVNRARRRRETFSRSVELVFSLRKCQTLIDKKKHSK
ncbi:hypothetical protein QR98_0025020 [Sarcoptes scabiei]|uniref:Uncharacterized protein n=1 Tax=Sarcoptes scabiei TaxID=52283 RepID=A0A131ZZG2_SARSC|nr:hypothetical protein QR98_0025020 [Sarcoptes scabiei]